MELAARKIIDNLSKYMAVVATFAVFIILVITSLDVILCELFTKPIPGATELISVILPFCVYGFLLETQIQKKHIVVDIFIEKFPHKLKKILDSCFRFQPNLVWNYRSCYDRNWSTYSTSWNEFIYSEKCSGSQIARPPSTYIAINCQHFCLFLGISHCFTWGIPITLNCLQKLRISIKHWTY